MHLKLRSPGATPAPFLAAALFSFLPPTWAAPAGSVPATATPSAVAPTPAPAAVENSVVKVFSTMRHPDFFRPWTKSAPGEATGSGVVIEGRRILTNAHMVLYASQVQVQANQAGDKISATVEAVAPGIDLALLKLDDETFFDTHPALPRANILPEIKDSVLVYGFPTGGTTLSITKGIVSRIEFTSYNFPVSGLRIQIDAAINPGNSGGPAVAGDKIIGLAFSRLGGAENIGYIIPCEEIELFLRQVAGGHPYGKPAIFDDLQTLENSALRPFLKLDPSVTGMVVTRTDVDSPPYPLKPWDVITKIGDTSLDDQGMVKVTSHLHLRFQYEIQKIAQNGFVPLTIVRAGKTMAIKLPVATSRPMLLPDLSGTYPSYFIFGPISFTAATGQFLEPLSRNVGAMDALSIMGNPMVTRWRDRPAFPGEQLVVIPAAFFPHKLAENYSNPSARVVRSVNGVVVKSLNHLVELLRDSKEKFITFEFYGRGVETLVFPRQAMLDATDDILTDNGVRSQGSPDTMAIWSKPARP